MPKISIDEIETTAKTALIKHGADDAIAKNFARAVAQAEGLGNRICGLDYLESYCVQLQSSRVRGDVSPTVSQPNPGVVHVDATRVAHCDEVVGRARGARRRGDARGNAGATVRASLLLSACGGAGGRGGEVHEESLLGGPELVGENIPPPRLLRGEVRLLRRVA